MMVYLVWRGWQIAQVGDEGWEQLMEVIDRQDTWANEKRVWYQYMHLQKVRFRREVESMMERSYADATRDSV